MRLPDLRFAYPLVLAVALAAPTSAAARQLFVTPDGSAVSSCEQYSPCTPQQAINGQARGDDEVVISPGSYSVTAPLVARDRVTVRGESGQTRPTLSNNGTGQTTVSWINGTVSGGSIYEFRTLALTDHASASHLNLVQSGEHAFALDLEGTMATDIVAVATGNYSRAVLANDGSSNDDPLLRDAFAFANGGAATAIQTWAQNLHLRNVLAIAPYVSGDALDIEGQGYCYGFSCPGAIPSQVDAKNTILRGALADVALTTNGYSGSYAQLNIDHSNLRPIKVVAPGGHGYLNDRGANQSSDPLFVNSQAGDYHPAAGSPTIDAGTDDVRNGAADLDGNARASGGGVDIGPYEYITPRQPEPQPDDSPRPAGQQPITAPPTIIPRLPPGSPPASHPATKPPSKPVLPAACRKVKGTKRSVCVKRQKALTKCRKLEGARKRSTCVRKAKRIMR